PATAEVSEMARGAVKKVKVTNHGTVYTRAPAVKFSDEGSGAIAIAQIDASGSVTGVTVREGGRGYTSDTTVTLVDPVPAAQAIVKPDDIIGGAITKVTVAEPGTGYTSDPEVEFKGGGGSGATATAELGTWGWGAGMDQGTDGKLGSGYFSEQILSTSMFRAYRSIGGDAAEMHRRGVAARRMALLMLQAVGQRPPPSHPKSAAGLLQDP